MLKSKPNFKRNPPNRPLAIENQNFLNSIGYQAKLKKPSADVQKEKTFNKLIRHRQSPFKKNYGSNRVQPRYQSFDKKSKNESLRPSLDKKPKSIPKKIQQQKKRAPLRKDSKKQFKKSLSQEKAKFQRKLRTVSSRDKLQQKKSGSTDRQSVGSKLYSSMDLLSQQRNKKKKFKMNFTTRTKEGRLASNPNKCNQDSILIKIDFQKNKNIFAIADGHGHQGHLVSQFIKDKFFPFLQSQPSLKSMPLKALCKTFERINTQLGKSNINAQLSGSTLSLIMVQQNFLFTANVGDSRAILCRKKNMKSWEVSDITRDHKPCLDSEKSRILRCGGRVQSFRDQYGNSIGPQRVWLKNQGIPGLAMSRSIGDNIAKGIGVTCIPQLMRFQLQNSNQFLLVASDGIWDFLTKQEIAQIVVPLYQQDKIEQAGDRLLETAYSRWTSEDEEVVDDISFALVFLRPQ